MLVLSTSPRFYQTSTRIFQVCFKYLRFDNFIEKCTKNFYWTSSKISIGHPLESLARIYWTSSRIALLDVHQSRRFGGMFLELSASVFNKGCVLIPTTTKDIQNMIMFFSSGLYVSEMESVQNKNTFFPKIAYRHSRFKTSKRN